MPYTDFDRALLDAWHHAHEQAKGDPTELQAILRRRRMATYTRPLPFWTLVDAFAGRAGEAACVDPGGDPGVGPGAEVPSASAAFLCLKCAGLVYESAERTSSPGASKGGARRRVDADDRFVKRISGGVLRGREVFALS